MQKPWRFSLSFLPLLKIPTMKVDDVGLNMKMLATSWKCPPWGQNVCSYRLKMLTATFFWNLMLGVFPLIKIYVLPHCWGFPRKFGVSFLGWKRLLSIFLTVIKFKDLFCKLLRLSYMIWLSYLVLVYATWCYRIENHWKYSCDENGVWISKWWCISNTIRREHQ